MASSLATSSRFLSRFLSTREITLPASFFDENQGVVSIGRGEDKYVFDAWKMFDEGIKLGGWKTISHQLAARRLATSLSLPSVLPRAIHLPEGPRLCFDTVLGPPPPTFPSRTTFSTEIVQTIWYRNFAPFETVFGIRTGIREIRRTKEEEEKRRETVQEEWRTMLLARRAEMRMAKDDEMEGLYTREDGEGEEAEVWERSRGFISESFVCSHGNKRETDPVSLAQLRALQPKPTASYPSPPLEPTSEPSVIDRKPFDTPPSAAVAHQHLPLPTPPSKPRITLQPLEQPSSSTKTPKQEPSYQTSTLLLSPPSSTSPQPSSSRPTPQRPSLSTPSPLRRTSAILVSSQTPSSLLLRPPANSSISSFHQQTIHKRSHSSQTRGRRRVLVDQTSLPLPRRTSRVPPPPGPSQPLQTSTTTQKTDSTSIPAIHNAHPAPTAPPTPSLVNSNSGKRPFKAPLLAPNKKPRSAHVSFLLPNDKENEHEEAAVPQSELDLEGYKIVIGMDVQGEQTREKLEEDVEVLGGEISVRVYKEDWEDDGEGGQVVLICWRQGGEGREGSVAAREEVESATKTGALLRTHLWVSSLKHPFSANLPGVTHQPREASVTGFEDFKICVTDYRDHHLTIVVALVHLTGATYSAALTDRCTHLLCPPDAVSSTTTSGSTLTESPKLTKAKKRALAIPGSIRVVRDGKAWLKKCLVNGGDDRQLLVEKEKVERAVAEAAAGVTGAGGSGNGMMRARGDDEVSLSGSLKELMLGCGGRRVELREEVDAKLFFLTFFESRLASE